MTYRNDYQLAEKMKNRFSGRGASVSGMRASSTSELMKRAQMGGDPSVNCSELDFRNGNVSVNRRANPNPQTHPSYANDPRRTARPMNGGMPGGRVQTRNSSVGGTSAGGKSKKASANAKNPTPARKPSAPAKTVKNTKKKSANVRTSGKTENFASKFAFLKVLSAKPAGVVEEMNEVHVEGRRLTPMFAVVVAVGMLMIMSIVMSFSESYQTTSDIALLESTLADLKDTAAELELELEEKNDIREIERIATEELGMVKEDAVQRKYLSLSDGEHIDLIDDGTADEETPGMGVLLSSIWSSLGNLFDYFR